MKLVTIDYEDGHYSVRECADNHPGRVELPDRTWEAYLSFCQQARVWNRALGGIDNDTYDERQARWTEWVQKGKPPIESR